MSFFLCSHDDEDDDDWPPTKKKRKNWKRTHFIAYFFFVFVVKSNYNRTTMSWRSFVRCAIFIVYLACSCCCAVFFIALISIACSQQYFLSCENVTNGIPWCCCVLSLAQPIKSMRYTYMYIIKWRTILDNDTWRNKRSSRALLTWNLNYFALFLLIYIFVLKAQHRH